jgi:murein DD-endopeptidase MepM/ murein hydrolase activator NlpD
VASKQHAPKAPDGPLYDPHHGYHGAGVEDAFAASRGGEAHDGSSDAFDAFDAFRANVPRGSGGTRGNGGGSGGQGPARRGYRLGSPHEMHQPQWSQQPQPPRQPAEFGAPQGFGAPQAYDGPGGGPMGGPAGGPIAGGGPGTGGGPIAGGGELPGDEPTAEWDPSEDSLRAVRGRHRVNKQRGGGMARSGAVLGVGVIAAVGAGGMATAKDKDPASISMPDLASAAHSVKNLPGKLKQVTDLPGVGSLIGDDSASKTKTLGGRASLTDAGLTDNDAAAGRTDAGEALRSRIMAQAQQQQSQAEDAARAAAAKAAAHEAQAKAEKKAEAEKKAAAERKRKAEEEKHRKEEAARRAKLARAFKLPVTSYTLTAGFGQSGSLWQNDHTGQDFAAPTGTPIKAIHSGTVTSAGWAGSYGYRTVLKLDDGTELWFCHQSSMTVKAGDKVRTGDVIGRVGATGNVTGPHLHLEVRPGGGSPIDPMPWLREKGMHP